MKYENRGQLWEYDFKFDEVKDALDRISFVASREIGSELLIGLLGLNNQMIGPVYSVRNWMGLL